MKNISLVIFTALFLTSNLAIGQKLDRENVGYYKYTQPPINTVLIPFNSYKVEGKGMNADAYRRDIILANTNLAGFEKMDESVDADLKVVVEEYPVTYEEAKRTEKVEKYKVDGVEKTRKLYTYACAVKFKYVIKIFHKNGEKLVQDEFSGVDNVQGSQSTSSSNAYEDFSNKKKSFHKEITASKVKGLCNKINDNYGFPIKSYYIRTATAKAKKENYDDFFKAYDLFKKGYTAVSENEDNIEEAATSLNEAITIWQEILKESDVENKKARINEKITMVTYANIGFCYFLMKDYPNAIEFFNKSKELDKSFGSVNNAVKISQSMVKRIAAFDEANAEL